MRFAPGWGFIGQADFQLVFGSEGLERAQIDAELVLDATLEVQARASVQAEVKTDLARVTFATRTIPVAVGPFVIPVVVTPVATLSMGALGGMEAGYDVKATASASAGGQIIFDQVSDWDLIPRSNVTMGIEAAPVGDGLAEVYLEGNLELQLYGVGGPFIGPKLYYQVTSGGDCWTDKYGLTLVSGVSLQNPFSDEIVSHSFPEVELYSGSNGPSCYQREYPSLSNLRVQVVRNAPASLCFDHPDHDELYLEFQVDYRAGSLDLWFSESETGTIDFTAANEPSAPGDPGIPGGFIVFGLKSFYEIAQGTASTQDQKWSLTGNSRSGTVSASFCTRDEYLKGSSIRVTTVATDERNVVGSDGFIEGVF